MEEVLGFVTTLKEEKNCKVVLIFNDEELGERSEVYRLQPNGKQFIALTRVARRATPHDVFARNYQDVIDDVFPRPSRSIVCR